MNRNLSPQEFGDFAVLEQDARISWGDPGVQRGFLREVTHSDRQAARPVRFLEEVGEEATTHERLRVDSALERATGKMVKPDYYGDYNIWAPEVNPNPGSAAASYLTSGESRN